MTKVKSILLIGIAFTFSLWVEFAQGRVTDAEITYNYDTTNLKAFGIHRVRFEEEEEWESVILDGDLNNTIVSDSVIAETFTPNIDLIRVTDVPQPACDVVFAETRGTFTSPSNVEIDTDTAVKVFLQSGCFCI